MTVSWENLEEISKDEVINVGDTIVCDFQGPNCVTVTRIVGEQYWGFWCPTTEMVPKYSYEQWTSRSIQRMFFLKKKERQRTGFSAFVASKGL